MKTPVPDSDSIARLCSFTTLDEAGDPTALAFKLKPDEPALSVNWLEHLGLPTRNAEVAELQALYLRKFKRVGTQARIAVLNVGAARTTVRSDTPDRRVIDILHDPVTAPPAAVPDPSHSGIYNLPTDESGAHFVGELLADLRPELHPAKKA